MKVQEKIRSMRESKNWSQEEMATKLNMSVNGYSKIERGETNPHISKLEQIAKELNVDLLELMSGGKNVYLIRDNSNHGCNVIGSSTEIAFEIQKLQMQLSHKDEIIDLQKREIARLEEIIVLMKSAGNG
ncbi:MAG: helix-turn-helix transcriptional regulator [Methylococcaceae bacterium]